MSPPPVVVVSDVHLSHTGPLAPGEDLAALLRRHPRSEVLLAGDVFDLSLDPPNRDPAESLYQLVRRHAELRNAWRDHLGRGAPLTFIPGNHDAAIISPGARGALLEALETSDGAPLTVSPWFVRRGDVHIEHGHLYDPDNAPVHPLALWSSTTEPLGVAITRRFLAPNAAYRFAHAQDATPLRAVAQAFLAFGPRAPLVIARYFTTAAVLCAHAARSQATLEEHQAGSRAVHEFAEGAGLDEALVHELAALGGEPTHTSLARTFSRLYLDRALATAALSSGGIATLFGRRRGIPVAAIGAAYLIASISKSVNRYRGRPDEQLRAAAQKIIQITGARWVVFGHTHREDSAPGYVNTGSFTYCKAVEGRPYVSVDELGNAERRYCPSA